MQDDKRSQELARHFRGRVLHLVGGQAEPWTKELEITIGFSDVRWHETEKHGSNKTDWANGLDAGRDVVVVLWEFVGHAISTPLKDKCTRKGVPGVESRTSYHDVLGALLLVVQSATSEPSGDDDGDGDALMRLDPPASFGGDPPGSGRIRRSRVATLTRSAGRKAHLAERLLTPSKITAWLDSAHYLTLKHEVESGSRPGPAQPFGSFARLLQDKGLEHEPRCSLDTRRRGVAST